jgi:AcrR family transcriptional regulator
MNLMTERVKSSRKYSSPLRAGQAAATRQQVLDAGWLMFTTRGYAATTVADVAEAAGVSVDTLYATVGRKSVLLRAVIESAISGTPETVPAEERDYVRQVRAAPDAATALRIYAKAIVGLSPRTAPIFAALRDAARTDPACAALDDEISSRRASNMLLMAHELRTKGGLRSDLDDRFVADTIWATAGSEHYLQLVRGRGWTAEQFGNYLTELWTRTLLAR